MSSDPHAKEWRATKGALRVSEERYRAIFEQAAVGIVHTSLEGKVRLVNAAFCAISGYSAAEARRFHIADITHPEDIDPSLAGRARLLERSSASYQRELRLLRKDGSYLWTVVTTSLVCGADGMPVHFVSVLIDISERRRAEEELNRFRAAMDVSVDSIFLTDPASMRVLYVNETACRQLGLTREQLLQKPPCELIGRTREELQREDEQVIAAGEGGTRTETCQVRGDGAAGWIELYRRALSVGDGSLIVTIARDVTERRAQQERIERLSRVHAVLSGINSAIVRTRDRDELFRESCRIAHQAGGFEVVWVGLMDEQTRIVQPLTWHGRDASIRRLQDAQSSRADDCRAGRSLLLEMIATRTPAITNDALNDPRVCLRGAMADLGFNSAAFLPLMVSDRIVGAMAMYSPVRGHFDDAEVKLLSELAADISFALDHLEKSERATYLALYDETSGLPNRQLLAERLGQFLHAAGRAHCRLALALLDLERLRSVNQSVGRRAGDALLRQVAERLVQAAGANEVGRIASNQFAVMLPGIRDRREAARMMGSLARACFAEPYNVEGTELTVGARTGLAIYPNDGSDAETLLGNAEVALRKAKQSNERQVFYRPDLGERTAALLPLEAQLAGALKRQEFVLHYQPKVDAAEKCVVGLEALIRWQSPELGLVAPGKFIPLMEETGMILEVGAWALERAAIDHRRWVERGLSPLRIAVNVSPIQMRQRDFVQAVKSAIGRGLTPTGIDLEITETLVMEDVEANIRKLNEIRSLGLQIAIDDFGTGYSSLAYLARLPIQALKIDRSFIAAMMKDSAAMTLVRTMISLAHSLRIKVIAEGVEEQQQAQCLRLMRCDQIQGYLISKPVPFDEMTELLCASRIAASGQR
jgi:PAS domain S-box-containing protein/diguanylate cyclase (GGDEF)-like protein